MLGTHATLIKSLGTVLSPTVKKYYTKYFYYSDILSIRHFLCHIQVNLHKCIYFMHQYVVGMFLLMPITHIIRHQVTVQHRLQLVLLNYAPGFFL